MAKELLGEMAGSSPGVGKVQDSLEWLVVPESKEVLKE